MMKISVIIVVRNEAEYIGNLLKALTQQTSGDFEVIIVDNGSNDGTGEIVQSFKDGRIKYFSEPAKCGLASLRNFGIMKASAKYIFFTDGDCLPTRHWLEEGLTVLETGEYVGVEGATFYETQQEITVSDYYTHNLIGGMYMTCNMGYTRAILEKVNYFDPIFRYGYEDREMAFRILKFGKIFFSKNMLVAHQMKKLTIKALFNRAKWSENMVDFIKRHKTYPRLNKHFLFPERLLIIFCPFILIFAVSYRNFHDIIIGFFKYIAYIYERIIIWRAAIKNRILVI